MSHEGRPALVVDANVLIDYANTDPSILALAARHLSPILILLPILQEVQQLDESDCDRLGLRCHLPSTEELLAAGEGKGPLSFQDHLCLIIARREGAICVTNEKPLRKACRATGVGVRWGLELMIELVRANQLRPNDALEVARAIRETNPHHITSAIVDRFRRKLGI